MSNESKASAPLDRLAVIAALTHLREEWEDAADGQPLHTVQGNVGLLLDDVLDALDLTILEKGLVRGQWHKGVLHVR